MTTPEPKTCSKCGIRPRAPGQRRCLTCHAEYMRDWRLQQTTIRLWPDNYEYLRRRVYDEHPSSMSKLINEAIDQQRRRHERRQDDSEVSRETKHG